MCQRALRERLGTSLSPTDNDCRDGEENIDVGSALVYVGRTGVRKIGVQPKLHPFVITSTSMCERKRFCASLSVRV